MTIKDYTLTNSKLVGNENQIVAVLKHKQKDEYAYIKDVYKSYDSLKEITYCVVVFEPSSEGLPISTFDNIEINNLDIELFDYYIDENNSWLFKNYSVLLKYLESLERKQINNK